MALNRSILVLLVSTLAAGCTKVKFSIDHPPARFTTAAGNPPALCRVLDPAAQADEDTGLVQQALSSVHSMCNPGQPCITGVDWVNRYDKVGNAGASEYMFQYLDFQIKENRACAGLWANMGSGPRLEYWPIPAFDTQTSWRCAEGQLTATVSAVAGVIDITDLDSDLQKTLSGLPTPTADKSTMISPATVGNDVFRRIKDKVDKEHKITWNSKYQYDYCTTKAGPPGQPPVPDPQTDCGPGKFHCLKVNWTDSNGSSSAQYDQ
jgi:hypothetical protein